jgi:cytoskeletal protein CcmA (bactofilin family)
VPGVDGNLHARERIELTAKAKMKGDLVAAKLVVAEGASFVGHVTVGPEATKAGSMAEPKAGVTLGMGQPNLNKPQEVRK